jgi:hypothetical protein
MGKPAQLVLLREMNDSIGDEAEEEEFDDGQEVEEEVEEDEEQMVSYEISASDPGQSDLDLESAHHLRAASTDSTDDETNVLISRPQHLSLLLEERNLTEDDSGASTMTKTKTKRRRRVKKVSPASPKASAGGGGGKEPTTTSTAGKMSTPSRKGKSSAKKSPKSIRTAKVTPTPSPTAEGAGGAPSTTSRKNVLFKSSRKVANAPAEGWGNI